MLLRFYPIFVRFPTTISVVAKLEPGVAAIVRFREKFAACRVACARYRRNSAGDRKRIGR
jgi:hypothetical protein